MAILFAPCWCTHPPLYVPSALSAHAEPIASDLAKMLQHKLKVSWRVYLSLVVKGLIVDLTLRLSVFSLGTLKTWRTEVLAMFVATTVPWDLLAKYSHVKKRARDCYPFCWCRTNYVTRSDIMKLNAIRYEWDLECLKPSAQCTLDVLEHLVWRGFRISIPFFTRDITSLVPRRFFALAEWKVWPCETRTLPESFAATGALANG